MMELLASLENSGFGTWLRESPSIWAYPAVLTLHTIGLGVLVGGNAVLDLRLLGWGRAIPLAPLEKLFPVMWIGFWVNAISGVALFVGDATTKGTTWVFMTKLAIIVVGVVLSVRAQANGLRARRAGVVETPRSRALAAASLALWFLAIVTGRYMAYVYGDCDERIARSLCVLASRDVDLRRPFVCSLAVAPVRDPAFLRLSLLVGSPASSISGCSGS